MRNTMVKLLLSCLLATALVACGNDESDGDDSSNAPVASCASDGAGFCDIEGFCADQEDAYFSAGSQVFAYAGTSTGSDGTVYRLSVSIYQGAPYNGPTAPGTYEITGADTDYADCGLCVMAETDCNGRYCEKQFLAAEGTVRIDTLLGSQFKAQLSGVNFVQLTDDRTGSMVGGDVWCLPTFGFDTPVETNAVASSVCEPYGSGTLVGDNISDFSLQNCDGDWVSLHDACDTSTKAIWMMSTAGWCPACEQTMPDIVAADAARVGQGLDLWVIIGEDASYRQPTLSYCQSYASRHNLDPARTFIDHDGSFGWAIYFSNVYPYPDNGMIGTPSFSVLRASNMEYVSTSVLDSPTVMFNQIDALLNE